MAPVATRMNQNVKPATIIPSAASACTRPSRRNGGFSSLSSTVSQTYAYAVSVVPSSASAPDTVADEKSKWGTNEPRKTALQSGCAKNAAAMYDKNNSAR